MTGSDTILPKPTTIAANAAFRQSGFIDFTKLFQHFVDDAAARTRPLLARPFLTFRTKAEPSLRRLPHASLGHEVCVDLDRLAEIGHQTIRLNHAKKLSPFFATCTRTSYGRVRHDRYNSGPMVAGWILVPGLFLLKSPMFPICIASHRPRHSGFNLKSK